jgi:hypothetical protein
MSSWFTSPTNITEFTYSSFISQISKIRRLLVAIDTSLDDSKTKEIRDASTVEALRLLNKYNKLLLIPIKMNGFPTEPTVLHILVENNIDYDLSNIIEFIKQNRDAVIDIISKQPILLRDLLDKERNTPLILAVNEDNDFFKIFFRDIDIQQARMRMIPGGNRRTTRRKHSKLNKTKRKSTIRRRNHIYSRSYKYKKSKKSKKNPKKSKKSI